MNQKLTIFDLLAQIDKKQYNKIEEEEVNKTFVPFLSSKWLAYTSDASQIYIVNETVNPYTFSLHRHKHLLWKLMCGVGNGKQKRYTWIKSVSASRKSSVVDVIAEHHRCSTKEAREYVDMYDEDDIIEMAARLGKDKEEINKIKKEFK